MHWSWDIPKQEEQKLKQGLQVWVASKAKNVFSGQVKQLSLAPSQVWQIGLQSVLKISYIHRKNK